ncbi:MAG: hypothetical protein COC01_07305 [Bacteroidetes bacterium]|nr:MAG: hypothetical protein COC01_07305 [Bacteroidota bacterium]
MKITLTLIVILATAFYSVGQDVYLTKTAKAKFYSEAPLENIEAISEKMTSIVNTTTKAVVCKVAIKSFVFEKPLMQEHFNEKYMESEKHPYGQLKGTIVEDVDLSKDGTYEVTWKGDLTLHGVTQPREIKGTITVKDGKITIHAVFNVKIEDHKIEVPSIVIDNIAEVVEVTFDATHELYTK